MRTGGIENSTSRRTASAFVSNFPFTAITTRVRSLIASTISLLTGYLLFGCVGSDGGFCSRDCLRDCCDALTSQLRNLPCGEARLGQEQLRLWAFRTLLTRRKLADLQQHEGAHVLDQFFHRVALPMYMLRHYRRLSTRAERKLLILLRFHRLA